MPDAETQVAPEDLVQPWHFPIRGQALIDLEAGLTREQRSQNPRY